MDVGYFGHKDANYNIERLVDGKWVMFAEDVGGAGWMLYLERAGDDPNYRAVDADGKIILNPVDRPLVEYGIGDVVTVEGYENRLELFHVVDVANGWAELRSKDTDAQIQVKTERLVYRGGV